MYDGRLNFARWDFMQPLAKTAAGFVLPAACELTKRGITYHVGTPSSSYYIGYGHAFVELFDTSSDRNILLSCVCDSGDHCLYLVPSRLRFTEKFFQIRTPQELIDYVDFSVGKPLDGYVEEVLRASSGPPGDFYVYRHIFPDGRIYIGKGRGGRAHRTKRNWSYEKAKKDAGEPVVEVLLDNLSEPEAYNIEAKLINKSNEILGFWFVLNITEGLERPDDIGDMPSRTLYKMKPFLGVDLDATKFGQKINIFWRASDAIGAERNYQRGLTIHQAAITLRCTMNEVIAAIDSPSIKIKSCTVLTDEKLEAEINRP